jgi:hypothetical protein
VQFLVLDLKFKKIQTFFEYQEFLIPNFQVQFLVLDQKIKKNPNPF